MASYIYNSTVTISRACKLAVFVGLTTSSIGLVDSGAHLVQAVKLNAIFEKWLPRTRSQQMSAKIQALEQLQQSVDVFIESPVFAERRQRNFEEREADIIRSLLIRENSWCQTLMKHRKEDYSITTTEREKILGIEKLSDDDEVKFITFFPNLSTRTSEDDVLLLKRSSYDAKFKSRLHARDECAEEVEREIQALATQLRMSGPAGLEKEKRTTGGNMDMYFLMMLQLQELLLDDRNIELFNSLLLKNVASPSMQGDRPVVQAGAPVGIRMDDTVPIFDGVPLVAPPETGVVPGIVLK